MPKVLLTKASREKDAMVRAINDVVNYSGLYQSEIARSMEISPVTLSRWLRDPSIIPLGKLRRLMDVCSADDKARLKVITHVR